MTWAPDYAASTDFKAYLGIDDDDDDVELALALTAASRAIDRHTRRQFGVVAAPEARYYAARWSRTLGVWLVAIDDLQSTMGLVVKLDTAGDATYTTTISAGDYVLRPRNAVAKSDVWTELMVRADATNQPDGTDGEFEITAPWGWTAFPDAVVQACLLQASRVFKRKGAPFGIAGSPDTNGGSEMRLLAKVDPDVAVALDLYRKRARPQ